MNSDEKARGADICSEFATKCAFLVQNSKKVRLRRAICEKITIIQVRNLT